MARQRTCASHKIALARYVQTCCNKPILVLTLNFMNPINPTSTTITNFDLPSVHILLDEIKVALKDAEIHLSEFHDDEEQVALLLDSATVIEQLASIFHLINFKGADKLATAIAECLKKLHDDGDNTNTALVMDISEGIMVLDRYVEFVLLKELLEPALLVAVINKLRAHTGAQALSADALSEGSSISITNPKRHYTALNDLNVNSKNLIAAYRAGLGVVLAHQGGALTSEEQSKIEAMSAACATIAEQSDTLFWQAAKIATEHLALPVSNDKKRVLIYVEQQLQHYLPVEDRRFADLVSLAVNYDQSFLASAVQKYGLGKMDSSEQSAMQRFLFGPNREITDTVNSLIQEEISTIKEHVDNFARGDNNINAVTIPQISAQILHLGQTMQLLGLDEASRALQTASQTVKEWQTPTPEDFDKLLGELMVAENAAIFLAKSHTPGAVRLPLHNRSISLHQLDTAYALLTQESRANISNIIAAIEAYLADANKDSLHLQNVPEILEQTAGAATFLRLPKTAKMLSKLAENLQARLDNKVLDDTLFADIADIIVAADYQLEGQEQNRPVSTSALLVGQHSLSRLLAA